MTAEIPAEKKRPRDSHTLKDDFYTVASALLLGPGTIGMYKAFAMMGGLALGGSKPVSGLETLAYTVGSVILLGVGGYGYARQITKDAEGDNVQSAPSHGPA